MSKTRKHRLYVDVTFDKKLSSREAAKALQLRLDQMPISDNPVTVRDDAPYVDKVVIIEPAMSRERAHG